MDTAPPLEGTDIFSGLSFGDSQPQPSNAVPATKSEVPKKQAAPPPSMHPEEQDMALGSVQR